MHNNVTVLNRLASEPERYYFGTLIQIDDGQAGMMPGGVYMLAACGEDEYVTLVNLETGGTRNGLMKKETGSYSVSMSNLRKNIGFGNIYRVIHRVLIETKD